MRIIKFRAWDIGNQKILTQEDYRFEFEGNNGIFRIYDNYSDPRGIRGECVANDKHCHIMQFTGLLDKNGKEIYEGDIVKAHYFGFNGNETDEEIIGEIVYRPDGMLFVITNKEQDMTVEDTTHFEEPCIEIIGNIYENPELLK